jgi:hypothetical protein
VVVDAMATYDVIPDVHQDYLPDNQPVLMVALSDGNDLIQATFHVHWRFSYPGRLDYVRWRRRQPSNVELTDLGGKLGSSPVHSLGDVVHYHVDHKLAGLLNICQGILTITDRVTRRRE